MSTTGRSVPARPGVGVIAANTAMLWLSIATAALTLWPVYRSAEFVILVAVSLAVGSIISILGAVYRWSSLTVLLATILAFLVVGVPVAVPTEAQYGVLPTLEGAVDLVTGVALGWKQLLTISLPVGDYEALLVPALVLVLGLTVIGLSVALRARHGELAVLSPILLFIAGTALGPNYPDRPLVAPIALLVVVLFWLVWFRWYRRRRAVRALAVRAGDGRPVTETGWAGIRAVLAAAVVLAIASGAAVAAVAAVPPAVDRTVLRTSIELPFDPRNYVSPLSGFRSYWQSGTVESVLFQVNELPEGTRIRLATLDSYDGVVYSVGSDTVSSLSGSFTRVPSSFDQSAVSGEQVTMDVTVVGYNGVWVPTVGKFEAVEFGGGRATTLRDAFYYNDVSGGAAVIAPLTEGDSYSITGIVPNQPSDDQLATLDPGSARVPQARNVPEELTAKLEEYTAGLDTAGERLAAMLAGLARDGYISHGVSDDEPPSRSGHAADRIAELLTEPRMIGDAEQYAVTAALMAADLGFPSRVVLGFVPSSTRIMGNDVSAWIEVDTAQYGWVTIDPTPPVREIPEEVPEDNAQVTRPQTVVPPPVLENEDFDRQATPESEQDTPPELDPLLAALFAVLRVAGWVALVVAIILAPFILVIAAKVRRRRLRRRASDVTDRISGGWREFEDAVIDHGLSPAESATRSEIASIAGGIQSQVLAAVADRAVFAPDEPLPSDADSVWRAVDELRVALDSGLSRWQRLRARISLRSLGGYSVRRLFTRDRKTGP